MPGRPGAGSPGRTPRRRRSYPSRSAARGARGSACETGCGRARCAHQRALLDQLRYADDVGHHLTERGPVGQQPSVLARDRDARPGYQRVPQRLDEPATSRCCLLFGPNDTTLATSVWGRQTSFGAGLRRRWSGAAPGRRGATVTASQAPGGTVDGAHALLETLAAAGVEVCFANPGTTELPLVRALEATPGVRAILGLFEGVCTGAADRSSGRTRRPAATLLHLGPGLATMRPGTSAWTRRSPATSPGWPLRSPAGCGPPRPRLGWQGTALTRSRPPGSAGWRR